jgi:integrase
MMMEVEVAPIVDHRWTVERAAEHYLAALERRGKKPSSIRTSRAILGRWIIPTLGDRALETVKPEDVDDLRDSMTEHGLAPKTIRNYLMILGAVYRHVLDPKMRLGIITTNPVAAVELPQVPKSDELNFISVEEVRQLADAAQAGAFELTDRVLYLTAAMTGLRKGELDALRWMDVDFNASQLRVRQSWDTHEKDTGTPKGGVSRVVPLAPELAGEMERLGKAKLGEAFDPERHKADFVFADPRTGKPMMPNAFYKRYAATKRQAGIRKSIRIHDLRHTFGTQMAAAGTPLIDIQHYLGHTDLKMTLRYAHFAPRAAHELARVTQAFSRPEIGTSAGTSEVAISATIA